ncbi:MAG TPA: hypothetical protein VEX36_12045 [Thermoleophilaceae bacterium]|nr:hypothetical protein [Thermoleophilaceae bacterium]
MRLVRKLTLLAILAIAATALMAPAASGQEPLIHDQVPGLQASGEPGGNPCPAVVQFAGGGTAGGCRLHITGTNVAFVSHMIGGEVINASCNIEVVARLDSSVEGFFTHAEMTDSLIGECHRQPCGYVEGQSEGRPWSFYAKEVAAGVEALTALFCVQDDFGTQRHCEVDFRLVEPMNHRYGLNVPAGGATCHGTMREMLGTWGVEADPGQTGEMEAEQQVEINHTP